MAALVGVPPDNAVVEVEEGGEWREIPLDATVDLAPGLHFLVTRQYVMGGGPGSGR